MNLSQEKSRAAPFRFLLPSARDIIFIFLFWSLLAGTLSNRPLADTDIGWHIRTGQRILEAHALPRTDPYSSIMRGQPWFAWEWLYDLVLGVLYNACGLNGVVWLCAVLVASTFTLLLTQLLKRGTGILLAIALMLLAEAAATIHLFARPHIVSWLLVLLWFAALERWEQGSAPRWLPWFFPCSMLVWVNLHGEWLLGLALLAIYTLASAVEALRAHDPFATLRMFHRSRAMAWAWIASVAATLANPYGWRLHLHMYRYLNDRYLMNRIAEFRSPDFHGWSQRSFALILVLTLVALATALRSIPLSRFLVVLLSVYAGLLSARNLPVSSMLLALIIGPILWESCASLAAKPGAWEWLRGQVGRMVDFSHRMSEQELQLQGHIWPVVCAVAALAICLHPSTPKSGVLGTPAQGGRLGSRQLIYAHFDPKTVPVAAVDFLEKQAGSDPVFSLDSWGGYLIYRLYPRRQVVVDDRHDLYGSARIRQILILLQGETGWRRVLSDLQVRTVLLPPDSTLANLLRQLPQEWQVTYEDSVAVVLEKR